MISPRQQQIEAGTRLVIVALIAAIIAVCVMASRVDVAHGADLDLVTVETDLGKVTVARDIASRIVGLLADLKAAGVSARVKCFAARRGRHVRRSLHLTGHACDILPIGRKARGRNRMPTPAFMFTRRAAEIIAAHGLRNGCAFRDCGHVDSGRAPHRTEIARQE